ncbi:TetR/AcrR family transcriptional regulator [Amycolatopsis acidicola]|uniref:TetR/AcrR family transcriptional regulator n=1 Tax=Amycolatopsis acidicola TaxID=2596893 RepID=A0A5N0V2V0_9PSEU|nr:TetR/AcrR family transcriptional regulator [Amycolatopsis acidicola]KAA9159027.1 TetR/AcrR family transcriptional regulator [Amycolatopsis acidicola]
MVTGSVPRPQTGRPRDTGVDETILRATVRRFVEDGYTGMSLAKIASDAGTTRPTMYLRWPSKHALVVAAVRAALEQRGAPAPASPDGLPPKERVLRLLSGLRPDDDDEIRRLYATLLAESPRIPELNELLDELVLEPRTRAIAELLDEMKASGDVREDVNTEHAATMIYGAQLVVSLRTGTDGTDRDRESLDLLWPSIAAHPRRRQR